MIALELDFADLDFWPFLNFEDKNNGVAGGDALILRGDLRKLAAVLPQKFLYYHFRFLDFSGVKLAFHAQADFAFFEAVENVRLGYGVIAVVTNAPDLRALLDFKHDDLRVRAFGRILDAQFHILEELRVPQGLEVAAERLFIVGVAFAAKDAGLQRVRADSAVANELDAFDDELLLAGGRLLRGRSLSRGLGVVFDSFLAGEQIQGSRE